MFINILKIGIVFLLVCCKTPGKDAIQYDDSVSTEKVIIDSSKLERAYDNIYFGSKELSTKFTSLGGVSFAVEMEEIDSSYGLFRFRLRATNSLNAFDETQYDDIKKIISTKYGMPRNISILEKNTWTDALNALIKEKNPHSALLPDDDGNIIYLNQFENKSVRIMIGKIIDYQPIYKFDTATHKNSATIVEKYNPNNRMVVQFEWKEGILKIDNLGKEVFKNKAQVEAENRKKTIQADSKKL